MEKVSGFLFLFQAVRIIVKAASMSNVGFWLWERIYSGDRGGDPEGTWTGVCERTVSAGRRAIWTAESESACSVSEKGERTLPREDNLVLYGISFWPGTLQKKQGKVRSDGWDAGTAGCSCRRTFCGRKKEYHAVVPWLIQPTSDWCKKKSLEQGSVAEWNPTIKRGIDWKIEEK